MIGIVDQQLDAEEIAAPVDFRRDEVDLALEFRAVKQRKTDRYLLANLQGEHEFRVEIELHVHLVDIDDFDELFDAVRGFARFLPFLHDDAGERRAHCLLVELLLRRAQA